MPLFRAAQDMNIQLLEVENFDSVTGAGIQALVESGQQLFYWR